jgi:hypothetical protein
MGLLRYVLMAFSAVGAIFAIYVIYSIAGGRTGDPRWVAWVAVVVVALFLMNIYYLWRSDLHGKGRLSRIAGLWLDAKEADLRRRAAGNRDQAG